LESANKISSPAFIEDTNAYIGIDSAGNMIFEDVAGGPYELSELASGSSVWDRTGTDLSPLNAGDDVLLAVSNELLKWGDGDTYIQEASDDDWRIYCGDSLAFQLDYNTGSGTERIELKWTTEAENILPQSSGGYNLGATDAFWQFSYINRMYIEDTNTYIGIDSAGNMIFEDVNGGPYELSDLADGGGSGYIDGSGTAEQYARFTDSDSLTSGSELSLSGGVLSVNVTDLRIDHLSGATTRLGTIDGSGDLGTGDLTGHVTTSSGLTTALHITAITEQAALLSGLVSADELLVNDGGTLKRMDVSVLQAYMQDNLSFGSGAVDVSGTPANDQLAIWVDEDTLEGNSNLKYTVDGLECINGIWSFLPNPCIA
jgi:hypothetical protein